MLRFFLAALVAMAINLIMDLGFDAPMLLRWAVAIVGGVMFVRVLERRVDRKRDESKAEGDSKADSELHR